MASGTRKRKREFQVHMEEADLSFTAEGCSFLTTSSTKRRRQTIHGSTVRQAKPRSSPYRKVKSKNDVHDIVSKDNLRGSLRRRLSTKLFQHKMKKLQDYSLAVPEMDNFAILRSLNQNSTIRMSTVSKPHPKAIFAMPTLPENNVLMHPKKIASTDTKRFFTRVLSDHDLQQKIDHEIKMREGTAKLLAASKHPNQMLEAAKNLLSSNTRIISYMTELQKRKTAEVLGKNMAVEGNQLPCRATVSLSDLRIPLMWKDSDHFKNKGDYRRYAVFCLLKIGTEIYDTSMINNVDRSMTDITFDDVLLFNNIPHDFECNVEVYCHKLHEDLSMANTPKKLRKKINDLSGSVGRSVGKRLSGLNDSDIIGNMVLGPKFEMVAKGNLSLTDVDDSVRTFDLQLEATSDGNIHELPLFGHYCCRIAALPHCLIEPTVTGFLNLQQDGEEDKWKRYWCVLKNLQLACWSSPADVEVTKPLVTVQVTKSTQICDADPSTSKRSHTFHIKTTDVNGISQHILAADSKDDLNQWWDGFQQHLLDQALWKHAVDDQMDVKQSSVRKSCGFQRKSSIYDDTPLIEPQKRRNVISDINIDDDQLNKMLHTLMGEQKDIRGGESMRKHSTS